MKLSIRGTENGVTKEVNFAGKAASIERIGSILDKQRKKVYPMPADLKPNGYYAKLLSNDFCGSTSEMTSIHQYIYHHLQVVDPLHKDVSATLKRIAIVEMQHLHMLGQCIRQLGLFPEYRYYYKDQSRFWDAGLVSYGCDLGGMLHADIRGEYEAIAQYNWTMEVVCVPEIQKLLRSFIEDEEEHIEILYLMLESISQ